MTTVLGVLVMAVPVVLVVMMLVVTGTEMEVISC